MLTEQWLRHIIPGYVVVAPVILVAACILNSNRVDQTATIAILTAIVSVGPAVGFLTQQLDMWCHEVFFNLNPKRRPVLRNIKKTWEESKNAGLGMPSDSDVFLAWDYFF